MDASFKAAKELHGEVSSTNANFKKVYESLIYSNNSYSWFQVAEVGCYDNFMARHSHS